MDLQSLIWKLLNLLGALLLIAAGCVLLYYHSSAASIISGCYVVVFAVVLVVIEFWVPDVVEEYAKFLFVNAGRGVAFILTGLLTVASSFWLNILACVYAVLLGLVYIIAGIVNRNRQLPL